MKYKMKIKQKQKIQCSKYVQWFNSPKYLVNALIQNTYIVQNEMFSLVTLLLFHFFAAVEQWEFLVAACSKMYKKIVAELLAVVSLRSYSIHHKTSTFEQKTRFDCLWTKWESF